MCLKKSYLIFFLFFTFFACKKENKTSFSNITISTEKNDLVEVNIPKANGDENISKKINSTIKELIISALHIGNPDDVASKSIEESIDAFNKEYTDFVTDFPDTVPEWEAQIDGEVMFQSPEIISLAFTSYKFTGGAHGNLLISLLNFNAQTGNLIENSELFNDIESFKTLANTYFDKAIEDKNTLFEPTKFQLPENMGYGEEGVVLLYNTYEIAPYSTGLIEFVIPFEDAKPFLVFNSL
ncbi:DUF3298 and DUF4163 domain-containing protein [Litoribaculum gwangyangense]|uniref:DUF3298/DUF4163 domain-containing protein n=1 Tax=Litoribaculum gwangyangense TaxID=1130722 RepID=A0ABP9C166_9FLAO